MFKTKRAAVTATIILFVTLSVLGFFGAMVYSSARSDSNTVTTQAPGSIGDGLDLPLSNNLDGHWMVEQNGVLFNATIASDTIFIKMNKRGTSMVYWNGTFNSHSASGVTIVSNKVELDEIVLSGAEQKEFFVLNDTISFDFKAMGTSTKLVLTRT